MDMLQLKGGTGHAYCLVQDAAKKAFVGMIQVLSYTMNPSEWGMRVSCDPECSSSSILAAKPGSTIISRDGIG